MRRRNFLVGAAAVASACGDDTETTPDPDPVFVHGVASGDPLTDAVILWTRVTTMSDTVDVTWEIATDEAMTDVVASATVTTNADSDFTVKVDASGLSPATTYHYRFHAEDQTSPVGRTRTLPEGSPERVKLGVVSCASYAHGYFHVYKSLSQQLDLDAIVHLGDYIYEYGDGEYGAVRTLDPSHEIVSLEDYRKRYAHYRKDEDLQEVHRAHPFFAVWDDHEFANNAWSGGAGNHDPAVEGDFADRKAAAAKAYFEWMPIRASEPLKIFRSFRFGDLFELFMLDTRMWGRDEQAADKDDPSVEDPARTLLGDDQETWLYDGLTASTARFKIVAQQVMMAPLPIEALINTDQWDGYPAARARFYSVLTSTPVDDVMVLTGDIHTTWASDLVPDGATYDPATGEGAVAVELVVPGVTSPGLGELFAALGDEIEMDHPAFKLVELTMRGYAVLEIEKERIRASYTHFDRVEEREATEIATGSVAFVAGSNRLTPG